MLFDAESVANKLDGDGHCSKKIKIDLTAEESFPHIPIVYNLPLSGEPVDRRKIRRAGNYLLGPEIVGHRPVRNIVQYLARKENTTEFYQLKILQLSTKDESNDEMQGKMLLHTEHSVLSLLQNTKGVVKHHGIFTDLAYEEDMSEEGRIEYTGDLKKRVILILDCLIHHPYCDKSASYVTLQEYLMTSKQLSECEAIFIFNEIVKVVENIHNQNVIHRDLKLANIILNRNSKGIVLTNFCLGKYLPNENIMLNDQKGSPAYISPDVVCGKPYKGKPSDMWSLGVIFYIMLFGNFPFFKSTASELFDQISSGKYYIPSTTDVSTHSREILKYLLTINPDQRLKAGQLRDKLEALILFKRSRSLDQRVPSIERKGQQPKDKPTKVQILSKKTDQIVPSSSKISLEAILPFPDSDGVVPTTRPTPKKPANHMFRIAESNKIFDVQIARQRLNYYANNTLPTNVIFPTQVQNRGPIFRAYSYSGPSSSGDQTVRSFIARLDYHFIAGQMTSANNLALREFCGQLSSDFASNLQLWLMEEFGDEPLVRELVTNSDEIPVNSVANLFLRCGIQVERTIYGPKISRVQPIQAALLLTYMLKVFGYNNTYFITQLEASR